MYDRQREVAELVRKDKAVDYVNSTVGTGGPNPTNNYGRLFIALKREEGTRRDRHRCHSAPAANGEFGHRHGDLFSGRAEHQHYRPYLEERVPVYAAIERYRRALSILRHCCVTRLRRSTGCVTSQPTFTSRIRNSRSKSTVRRQPSMASRSTRSVRSCSTHSAAARLRRSTPRRTTTRSFWRASPKCRKTRPRCRRFS